MKSLVLYLETLNPNFRNEIFFIIDNLQAHKSSFSINKIKRNEVENTFQRFLFKLINPLELYFKSLKSKVCDQIFLLECEKRKIHVFKKKLKKYL